jgi:hypothetical protein
MIRRETIGVAAELSFFGGIKILAGDAVLRLAYEGGDFGDGLG